MEIGGQVALSPAARLREATARRGLRVESVTMARTAALTSSRAAAGTQSSSLTSPAWRRACRHARMRALATEEGGALAFMLHETRNMNA